MVATAQLLLNGSRPTVAYGILALLNRTHRWYRPDRSESSSEIGKGFAELASDSLAAPY